METKVLKVSKKTYLYAKKLIKNGENVAFPTETVYGLGADATNQNAVKNIFERKGRPQDNPLIVHFANKCDISKVGKINNKIEQIIIKKCMPGPISLVLEKTSKDIDVATCGYNTVAVRIPINKVARAFINACKKPICAPSANTSKRPSPTCANDVFEDMNGKIPLIIDGGRCSVGVESTVVRVIDGQIHILRPGKYSAKKLSKITKATVVEKDKSDAYYVSPGTRYAHYMPLVEMKLIKTDIVKNVNKEYEDNIKNGKKPIIFCSKQNAKFYKGKNYTVLGKNSEQACFNLFFKLRKFEKKFDIIIAEMINKGDMFEALFNRMSKSASGNVI